jgi:LytS/YehU family sensor histidine kinase
MSIEKKSLISTLKTTKKANAVSSELKPTTVTSKSSIKSARSQMRRAEMRRAELRRAELRRK